MQDKTPEEDTQQEVHVTEKGEAATSEEESSGTFDLSRRGTLAGLAGLGLVSATGSAEAGSSHLGERWQGSTSNGYGLKVIETSSGKSTTGLIGRTTSTADYSRGVQGKATASSGLTQGVLGLAESSHDNSVGVIGNQKAKSGKTIGLLGLNSSSEGRGLVGYAHNSSGNTRGLIGKVDSPDGVALLARHKASSGTTTAVEGRVNSSSGFGLYTPDDAKVDGTMEVGGDLQVTGVKNFVQTVSADSGPKQITYTAVEAGEPQTEHSDVTEMEDGVAVVELPDHFGMVTSGKERLTVQVTPYCDEPAQPQVTDRSTNRIVVKDFGDGPDEYSFAYTVKGVRQGFEDEDVVTDL